MRRDHGHVQGAPASRAAMTTTAASTPPCGKQTQVYVRKTRANPSKSSLQEHSDFDQLPWVHQMTQLFTRNRVAACFSNKSWLGYLFPRVFSSPDAKRMFDSLLEREDEYRQGSIEQSSRARRTCDDDDDQLGFADDDHQPLRRITM